MVLVKSSADMANNTFQDYNLWLDEDEKQERMMISQEAHLTGRSYRSHDLFPQVDK